MNSSSLFKNIALILVSGVIQSAAANAVSRPQNAINCQNVSIAGCSVVDQGRASCYGPGLEGNRTASGDRFNRYGMSAAHRTLPLGSKAVFINSKTGKACRAEISDRGPFIYSRKADLAQGLFDELGGAPGCHGEVNVKIYICPKVAKTIAPSGTAASQAPNKKPRFPPPQSLAQTPPQTLAQPVVRGARSVR